MCAILLNQIKAPQELLTSSGVQQNAIFSQDAVEKGVQPAPMFFLPP
jgi:hypothetical protein